MRNRRRGGGQRSATKEQKKFEDRNDPERRCGNREFMCSTPVEEHGRKEGECHSFFFEDMEQSVNIVEWADGSITCYNEDYRGALDD